MGVNVIDLEILKSKNTTDARLREIFTAVAQPDLKPTEGESKEEKKARNALKKKLSQDCDIRKRLQTEIQGHVHDSIFHTLRNWKKAAAADLAWDSNVLSGLSLPLQMYAQGKVDVQRAAKLLSECPGGDSFCKRDEKTGGVTAIDVPRFVETHINLVRSIITRRCGAQKVKFNELWPYYKYEARSTGTVAKCRADVLSQRVDMMADQYGYRHHDAQVYRDAFLYGHGVDFVRNAWEVEKQYERVSLDQPADAPGNVKDVVVKEGVGWTNPHPSRLIYNRSFPLSGINSDDQDYIGFWDIVPFGQIDDNPAYYNKSSIGWSARMWDQGGIFSTYSTYFSHYQYTIAPPFAVSDNPAMVNDRKSIQGIYNPSKRDASVLMANYFRKLVPKDYGIGEYPFPVWVRFVVASDSTVVYAQIMPSRPAAVLSINESDSRDNNVSMAMDLFPYQDQMSNLVTQLMGLCQMEAFKVIVANKDIIDADDLKRVESVMKGHNWFADPLFIRISKLIADEQGIKTDKAIEIVSANVGNSITTIFEAMIKLVSLTEKMTALSPAEQGQPAPREISATEVNEIATTTSNVYNSISDDIDEFRAAKKEIIYESLVSCSKGDIVCPVKDRYTEKTIKAAGFKIKQGEDEDVAPTTGTNASVPVKRVTVIGTPRALIHTYIFTTRDGSERPVNTQAANTLVQMVGFLMSLPMVVQGMGKEKLYEILNETFRMCGAGVDLNLQLKEGESDQIGEDEMEQIKQQVQQLTQGVQQLAQHVQNNDGEIADQKQVNDQQQEALKSVAGLAKHVQRLDDSHRELRDQADGISKKLIESIDYSKAPPSIQRQIEVQAGFTPATPVEHAAQVAELQSNGKPTTK